MGCGIEIYGSVPDRVYLQLSQKPGTRDNTMKQPLMLRGFAHPRRRWSWTAVRRVMPMCPHSSLSPDHPRRMRDENTCC